MTPNVQAQPTAKAGEACFRGSAEAQGWAAGTPALLVLLPMVTSVRYNFAIAETSMLRQPGKN